MPRRKKPGRVHVVSDPDVFAEAAVESIGRLGDKCLELDAQRRWLLEALESHSRALAAVLETLEEAEIDESSLRTIVDRVQAIIAEHCDWSDETIERLFPPSKGST